MMKFSVNQASLLAALESCATVADAKSPFPWGACVIIEAPSANEITARASNSIQSISRTVGGQRDFERHGAVMLNAKDALQVVASLGPGPVAIEEMAGSVRISQGRAKYNRPKFDMSAVPPRSIVEPQGSEIDARAFGAALSRVAPAMGDTESMVTTYGINCVTSGGKLWAKAINGHTAAVAPLTFDGHLTAMIPAPSVKHLQSVLASIEGVARIAVVGPAFFVFADGFTYSTLLTGTVVPSFDAAIPKRVGASAMVDRAAAIEAVRGAIVGISRDMKIRIRATTDGITFRGYGDDQKAGSRSIACDSTLASTAMCADYLIDLLKFAKGDTVTIWQNPGTRKIGGDPEPMVVEDDGALFVAMPIKYDETDLAVDSPEWT